MSPFDFAEYRSFLNQACSPPSAPRGYRAELARYIGCQASYLSQVLKARVHFTEDQLHLGAGHLGLSEDEIEYLLLQLRFEKAGSRALRSYLQDRMSALQTKRSQLKSRVDARESDSALQAEVLNSYFSTWIPSAVHLMTSSSHFSRSETIAERLNLPLQKVIETLRFLEKHLLVERRGHDYLFRSGSFHVAGDSALQPTIQATRRELAARSSCLNSPDSTHFSSLFTIDADGLRELKALLIQAIERSQKLIHKAGTDQLGCLIVELFEVI